MPLQADGDGQVLVDNRGDEVTAEQLEQIERVKQRYAELEREAKGKEEEGKVSKRELKRRAKKEQRALMKKSRGKKAKAKVQKVQVSTPMAVPMGAHALTGAFVPVNPGPGTEDAEKEKGDDQEKTLTLRQERAEKIRERKVRTRAEKPHSEENLRLHRQRYRSWMTTEGGQVRDAKQERVHFPELHAGKQWTEDHLDLFQMGVSRLKMDILVQRFIYKLQVSLVDERYNAFGKTPESWERYTLMFRNGWVSGDVRKPVTKAFQQYCESVYCPIMYAMLFGPRWPEIQPHWAQFKSCTIKVCEDTAFYEDNVFHMHVDGKIGILEKRNYTQKHMSRLLFSIVTDALEDYGNRSALKYGTTVFPIWQPKVGFRNNHEFHNYMQSLYRDRGLENCGLARPHYEMPENLVYRAETGEVFFHKSHADPTGPQPIHSEPNPNPDRHLYVFDFNNILRKDSNGRALPSAEVPEAFIIEQMEPLASFRSAAFKERLQYVAQVASGVLETADAYSGGRAAVESLLADITAALA